MLLVDLERRMIRGSCKAGDVKKTGLIQASINSGVEEDWPKFKLR